MPKKQSNNKETDEVKQLNEVEPVERCPSCGIKKRAKKEEKPDDAEKITYTCLRCNKSYKSKSCLQKHKVKVCYNVNLQCPRCSEEINICEGLDKIMDHFYLCETGGDILKMHPNEPVMVKEKINEMIAYIYNDEIKKNYEEFRK